eukprot:c26943_g1_i1.p1 GENE.c26943_g1_i1~~c26943_g1_i1.p1  ORF type:complete len:175 (+),score=23.16 c26943_g1_i1:1103-1627(+)
MAYLMISCGLNFEQAFQLVKKKRPISNPNPGFVHQLMELQRRIRGGVDSPRAYQIMPLSHLQPDLFVPKHVTLFTTNNSSSLLPPTALVLQCPHGVLFLWVAASCSADALTVAQYHVTCLQRYEHALSAVLVSQNNETSDFRQLLSLATSPCPSQTSVEPAVSMNCESSQKKKL